jgi:cytoskeletal protein CcmA (bactofilin family)
MKNLTVSAAIFMLVNTAFAYTGYNICNYGNQTIDSVICNSPTVMKDTTVRGDIKVTGSLSAKNINAQNVEVEGNTDISDSKIMGNVQIKGSFSANNVQFQKGVAVESESIMLNHSTVNGLMTITSDQNTPYLQMQCSSVISGSVLFSGKAGIVQITGESLIKGKVVNGSMEFVKRSCN